jgi:hypothetical protein
MQRCHQHRTQRAQADDEIKPRHKSRRLRRCDTTEAERPTARCRARKPRSHPEAQRPALPVSDGLQTASERLRGIGGSLGAPSRERDVGIVAVFSDRRSRKPLNVPEDQPAAAALREAARHPDHGRDDVQGNGLWFSTQQRKLCRVRRIACREGKRAGARRRSAHSPAAVFATARPDFGLTIGQFVGRTGDGAFRQVEPVSHLVQERALPLKVIPVPPVTPVDTVQKRNRLDVQAPGADHARAGRNARSRTRRSTRPEPDGSTGRRCGCGPARR